jgi:hypothetical protein
MAGRLFDLMQVKLPLDSNGIEHPSPVLDSGEIILVDNVADYFYDFLPDGFKLGDSLKMPWSYEKHYPFVSPPFEEMWFEFQAPKIKEIKRIGVKVKGMEMHSIADWDALDPALLRALVKMHGDSVIDKVKWFLMITPYSEMKDGRIMGPYGNYIIGVAPDGSLAKSDSDDHIYAINSVEPRIANAMQPLLVNPVLMAISFMHVKNASMLRQAPVTPLTKNQRKKAKKNPPTSRYYVLKIDAIERASGGSGGGGGPHGEASLHIVRGHFADYSNGAGLFGKYKGRYWVSSHLRGNPEVGVTEKDYTIK